MSQQEYAVAAYSAKSNEFLVPVVASVSDPESKMWVLIAPPASRAAAQDRAQKVSTRLPLPFHKPDESQQASAPLHAFSKRSFVASIQDWYEIAANSLPDHLGPTARENGAALARFVDERLGPNAPTSLEAFRQLLMAIYEMAIPDYEVKVGFLPPSLSVPGKRQSEELQPAAYAGILEVLEQMARGNCGPSFRGRGRVTVEIDGREDFVRAVFLPDPQRFDHLTLVTDRRGTYLLSRHKGRVRMRDAVTGKPVTARIRPVGSLRNVQAAAAGTLGHIPWHAATRSSPTPGQTPHITLQAKEFLSPHWPNQAERATRPGRSALRLIPEGTYLWNFCAGETLAYTASVLGWGPTAVVEIDVLQQIVTRAFGRREASAATCRRHARGVAADVGALFAIRLSRHLGFDPLLQPSQGSSPATPFERLWALNAALRAVRAFAHPQSRTIEPSSKAYLQANGLLLSQAVRIAPLINALTAVSNDLWAGEMRTPDIAAARRTMLDCATACAVSMSTPAALADVGSAFWAHHLRLTNALYDYMSFLIARIWTLTRGVLGADLFSLFLLLGPMGLTSAARTMVAARQNGHTLTLPIVVNQKGRS